MRELLGTSTNRDHWQRHRPAVGHLLGIKSFPTTLKIRVSFQVAEAHPFILNEVDLNFTT